MSKPELKQFTTPDEIREFPGGKAQLVSIGGGTVEPLTFQQGCRWANDLQPIAGP